MDMMLVKRIGQAFQSASIQYQNSYDTTRSVRAGRKKQILVSIEVSGKITPSAKHSYAYIQTT